MQKNVKIFSEHLHWSYLGNRCGDSEGCCDRRRCRSRRQSALVLILSFDLGQDLLGNQHQLTHLCTNQNHAYREEPQHEQDIINANTQRRRYSGSHLAV